MMTVGRSSCHSTFRQFPALSAKQDLSAFVKPCIASGSLVNRRVTVQHGTHLFWSSAEDPARQILASVALEKEESELEFFLKQNYKAYVSQDPSPLQRRPNYPLDLLKDATLVPNFSLQKRAILLEYASKSYWAREALQLNPLHILVELDAYTYCSGKMDFIELIIKKEPTDLLKKSAGKDTDTPIDAAIRFNCPPKVMQLLVDSKIERFGLPSFEERQKWQRLAANLSFVYDKIAIAYQTSKENHQTPYFVNLTEAIAKYEPRRLLKFLGSNGQPPSEEEFEQLAKRTAGVRNFQDYLTNL